MFKITFHSIAYVTWLGATCALLSPRSVVAESEWLRVGCAPQRLEAIGAVRPGKGIDSLTLFERVLPSKVYFRTRAESDLLPHVRLGTAGEECATARKRAECERRVSELAQHTTTCREQLQCPAFVIITAGDRVLRVDQPADVVQYLEQPVDTAGEAIMLAVLDGFWLECFPDRTPTVIRSSSEGLGFELRDPDHHTCTEPYARVFVGRDGVVKANSFKPKQRCVY